MQTVKSNAPELRHIVDVDGQLIGIEPAIVSTAVLKALARTEGELLQIHGAFEVPLKDYHSIVLREDEVLFFRTREGRYDRIRLAA